MADYNASLGVVLDDDFSKLSSDITSIISKLDSLTSRMEKLYNLSNRFGNSFKGLSGVNIDSKSINDLNSKLDKTISKLNKINGTRMNVNSSSSSSMSGIKNNLVPMDVKDTDYVSPQLKKWVVYLQAAEKGAKMLSSAFKVTYNVLGRIYNIITSIIGKIKQWTSNLKTNSNLMNNMFDIGKLYFFLNYSKVVFRNIGKIITSALDFTETENYFASAMGNMYDKAMEFQNKLTQNVGLSQNAMMKAQATYKNMLTSLGSLNNEVGEKISETLTQMTLDYGSLYNVDFNQAIKKFEAALSQQVRPIRSQSGYDITKQTLQGVASDIGVTKTYAQLSQVEKRLLIIIALQKQMANSNAFGDLARTIETPSNQLRILKEQLQEIQRWIGAVFEGTIAKVLPYINGFVMAIKEIIKSFALLVGYQIPNSKDNYLNSYSESADNVANSLDNATKSAKKWKNQVAGFDKATVLSGKQESSGSGASGGVGGIDPKILDALKEYNSVFDNIQMKATKIRDAILKWFKGDPVKNFKKLGVEVSKILNKGVIDLNNLIKWDNSGSALTKATDSLTGFLNSMIQNVNFGNIGILLGNSLNTAVYTAFNFISKINYSLLGQQITLMLNKAVNTIDWDALGNLIGTYFKNKIDFVFDVVNGFDFKKLGQSFDTMFNKAVDKIDFKKLGQIINKGIDGMLTTVITFISGGGLTKLIKGIGTALSQINYAKLGVNAARLFNGLIDIIGQVNWFAVIMNAVNLIHNFLINVDWGKLLKTLIKMILELIPGIIIGLGTLIFDIAYALISGLSTINWGKLCVEVAKDIVKALWKGIKDNFAKIGSLKLTVSYDTNVGSIQKGIYKALGLKGWPKISFAKNGMYGLDYGQLFVARESGPELVGNIGGQNAVVNNDQIVNSVSRGVASAVRSAMSGLQLGNSGDLYLTIKNEDGTSIEKIIRNYNDLMRRNGGNGGFVF